MAEDGPQNHVTSIGESEPLVSSQQIWRRSWRARLQKQEFAPFILKALKIQVLLYSPTLDWPRLKALPPSGRLLTVYLAKSPDSSWQLYHQTVRVREDTTPNATDDCVIPGAFTDVQSKYVELLIPLTIRLGEAKVPLMGQHAPSSCQEEESPAAGAGGRPSMRRRSKDQPGVQRNAHVLPHCCIICGSTKARSFLNRKTGARSTESLSLCELVQNNVLIEAAVLKGDDAMLKKILDKDMVAIEVRYHIRTCFKAYTAVVYKSKRKASGSVNCDNSAYQHFCTKVVKQQIIKNGDIFYMNKLYDLYTIENQHSLTKVSKRTLKQKLKRDFPQLTFIQPKKRYFSEIVMCEKSIPQLLQDVVPEHDEDSEDSDTDDEDFLVPPVTKADHFDQEQRKMLYTTGLSMRNTIADLSVHQKEKYWPPTADNANLEAAKDIVPPSLFNLLAWSTNSSQDVEFEKFVSVTEDKKRKLLSIAQDIIFLSHNGRIFSPKHQVLGLTMRHITGSSRVIDLLNGLGHSVSYHHVLEHDTALAEKQLQKKLVPAGFVKGLPVTVITDNNDFQEETISGKGTTHNTNGILVQRETSTDHTSSEVTHATVSEDPLPRSRRRKVMVEPEELAPYYKRKSIGPEPVEVPPAQHAQGEMDLGRNPPQCRQVHQLDMALYFSKLVPDTEKLHPRWTGFNIQLRGEVEQLARSKIGYLPVIDSPPTEMRTVNAVFERSLTIASELELGVVTLVLDQAFYAKAQQVRWNNAEYKKKTVVRLGEFHTCMSFLSVIGKRFAEAGLSNILLDSGVLAQGSLNSVISGRSYNRCMALHKALAEALRRLQIDAFLDSLAEEERLEMIELLKSFSAAFPTETASLVSSSNFLTSVEKFTAFRESQCQQFSTFKLWDSYCEMVELLLTFIRATREGNWQLHLETATDMVPWFFAYDHQNYARFMSVYLHEMKNLPVTHPAVFDHLSSGEFVVQLQENHPFSQIACDQAIEVTMNRDTKTKGGIIGFSQNAAAVHRWILSHHERAAIARKCHEMSGESSVTRSRSCLGESRKKTDEAMVTNLKETVVSLQNPFAYCVQEMINISSGVVADDDVDKDMLTAYGTGKAMFGEFVQQRLVTAETDFFAPIKSSKLKTFKQRSQKVTQSGENTSTKEDQQLLTMILLLVKHREIDMKDTLRNSLSLLPPCFSHTNGNMAKTDKSALLRFFEKTIPSIHVHESPTGCALIFDGMAEIQKMADHVPVTFGELAMSLLRSIVAKTLQHGGSRADFVCDRYFMPSIKDEERRRRLHGTGEPQHFRALSGIQKTPQQFRRFLQSGKNKESLSEFLFTCWSSAPVSELKDVTVFVVHGQTCHSLSASASDNGVSVSVHQVGELKSDHEEADTHASS